MRHRSSIAQALVAVMAIIASLLVTAGPADASGSAIAANSAGAAGMQTNTRAEQQPERTSVAETAPTGAAAEECRKRNGQRRAQNSNAASPPPGLKLGCETRVEREGHQASPFTGRSAVPRATRSVELALRHQVFRC